jgi:hypothetical protein
MYYFLIYIVLFLTLTGYVVVARNMDDESMVLMANDVHSPS